MCVAAVFLQQIVYKIFELRSLQANALNNNNGWL